MEPSRTVDAVIFDLGGVIMTNGGPRDFTRRYPEHDPAHVAEVLMGPHHLDTDHPWHRVERGETTLEEYRAATKRLLAEAGIPAPAPVAASGGPRFAFTPSEPMLALVAELREHGLRTGILTNNVAEMRDLWWPLCDFASLFDTVVDSHEVGMRKPDPAVYRLTLERLGAESSRTAFLDDLGANVDAARALGIHGVLVGADQSGAIAEVRSLAGIAAPAS